MATIVNISGTGDANYCYAQVNGTKYTKAASNITLTSNTIVFEILGNGTSFPGVVTIDGNTVLSYELGSATYSWTVPSNVTEINIVLTDKGYCTLVDVTTKKSGDSGGGGGEHYTLISGTAREIESGTVLIGGVLREIENGLVLAGGVAREIEFVVTPFECTITFLEYGSSEYQYVSIDGKKYIGDQWDDHDEIIVLSGTVIELYAKDNRSGNGAILLDGKTVASADPATYQYTVNGDLEITFEFASGAQSHVSKIHINTE